MVLYKEQPNLEVGFFQELMMKKPSILLSVNHIDYRHDIYGALGTTAVDFVSVEFYHLFI